MVYHNGKFFLVLINGSNFINAIAETLGSPVVCFTGSAYKPKVHHATKIVVCEKLPKNWDKGEYSNKMFWVDGGKSMPKLRAKDKGKERVITFKSDLEIEITKELKQAILLWIIQGAAEVIRDGFDDTEIFKILGQGLRNG